MKIALSLRPFQKKFVRGFLAPGKTCGVLSIPRGNGKSTFAAHLVARVLTPGDSLYREGLESVLCAASLEQARIVFKIARRFLGEKEYRYLDSTLRIGISHPETNTRLRGYFILGKNSDGDCRLSYCDYGRAGSDGDSSRFSSLGRTRYSQIQTELTSPGFWSSALLLRWPPAQAIGFMIWSRMDRQRIPTFKL